MGDKLGDSAANKFGFGLVTGMATALVIQLMFLVPLLLRQPYPNLPAARVVSWKMLKWEPNATTPTGPLPAVLESVKADSTTIAQIKDVMQSKQQLYCSNEVPELPRGMGSVQVSQHVTLYGPVNNGDLKYFQNTATIDSHMTDEVNWAIGQYRTPTTGELIKPLVLDIGAGIGWVTANAIKAGARVAAFEARPSMLQGLHKTLCSSPWMMESVVLYPMLLGLDTGDCVYVNLDSDGISSHGRSVCESEAEAVFGLPSGSLRATSWSQYTHGAQLVVSSLDKLFDQHIQLMKVHVHGSRPLVLEGAEALLRQGLVSHIILRVDEPMLQLAGKYQLLSFLHAHGYACSYFGFQGPLIQESNDYLSGKGHVPSNLLYQDAFCSLRRAAESAKEVAPISVRSRKNM